MVRQGFDRVGLRRSDEGTKMKSQPFLEKIAGKGLCRAGGKGHPPADASAILCRGQEPHGAGWPAR